MDMHDSKEIDSNAACYDEARLTVPDNHLLRLIEKRKITGAAYRLSRGGNIFARRAR